VWMWDFLCWALRGKGRNLCGLCISMIGPPEPWNRVLLWESILFFVLAFVWKFVSLR